MRIISYTSPELAYDSREALALAPGGGTPFREATLWPIHGSALVEDVLDVNYGHLSDDERDLLVAVDPPLERLLFLWQLQQVFNDDDSPAFGEIVRRALDDPDLEFEFLRLEALAVRRIEHASATPDAARHLITSWLIEDEALFALLHAIRDVRAKRREAALRKLQQRGE